MVFRTSPVSRHEMRDGSMLFRTGQDTGYYGSRCRPSGTRQAPGRISRTGKELRPNGPVSGTACQGQAE